MAAGAVANLQHTRQAVSAARAVLEHTTHTLLSGGQADAFAAGMGFTPRNLSTEESLASWHRWWAHNPRLSPFTQLTTTCMQIQDWEAAQICTATHTDAVQAGRHLPAQLQAQREPRPSQKLWAVQPHGAKGRQFSLPTASHLILAEPPQP